MAWLTGWSYRKSCTIRGSSAGAVTNYQIKIVVHYGSGTDSGQNVYLNGKCRSDFGDVRFTDSDGTTLLSYWIEELVSSNYAIFWVKVPSIPAYPSTKTIYIYYGKSSATSISNGDATFSLFENFDDLPNGSDPSGWTDYNSKWEVENGVYRSSVYSGAASDWNKCAVSTGFRVTNHAVHLKVKRNAEGTIPNFYIFVRSSGLDGDLSNSVSGYAITLHGGNDELQIRKYSSGSWSLLNKVAQTYGLVLYKVVVKVYSSTIRAICDSVSVSASDSTFSSGYLAFTKHNLDCWIDDLFVRKYVDPEPSITAWGSEESAAIAWKKTLTDLLGLLDRSSRRVSKFVFDRVGLSDFVYKFGSKVFVDLLGMTDAYSRSWGVYRRFSEVVGLRDYYSRSWSVKRVFVDRVGLLDFYSRTWGLLREYCESLALSDYAFKIPSKALIDSVGLVDYYTKIWSLLREYYESIGLSDYVSKEGVKSLTDSLVLVDSYARTPSKSLLDYIGVITSTYNFVSKTLIDFLGLFDYYVRIWNLFREYYESLGLLDLVSKVSSRSLIDYVALLDYYARTPSKVHHELLGLSDYVLKISLKVLADDIALLDSYARVWLLLREYRESLGLSDYTFKLSSKSLTDVLGLVDYYVSVSSFHRSYSEIVGLSDYLAKLPSKLLRDEVDLADYYSRIWSLSRSYSELLGVSDFLAKEPIKSLYDVLDLADYYSRMWSLLREYYESLGLSDYISKLMSKSLIDSVGLLDEYSRLWNVLREYYESLGLSDYVSKGSLKALREMILLWDAIAYVQNPLELWKLIRKLTWLVDIGVCDV